MKTAAVIPTRGRECFKDSLAAIEGQVDEVIVIAHNLDWDYDGAHLLMIPYRKELPNISEMWNLGLDLAADRGCTHVAVINDDAMVPKRWMQDMCRAIRDTGAAIASRADMHHFGYHYTSVDPIEHTPQYMRMAGHSFVVDMSKGLRLDEQFQWHYGDNDIDWQARHKGCTVIYPGPAVTHLYETQTTVGILRAIADADALRFQEKWGMLP